MEIVRNEDRLKKVLVADKLDNPLKIVNVLKSDILDVLKNYMDITSDNLDINITIDEYGYFVFTANSRVRRLKNLNAIQA